MALSAVLNKGDGVCMLHPEYPPFREVVDKSGYCSNTAHMNFVGDGYKIDWHNLESNIAKSRAFLVSNPHNPTGTVFSREEIQRILDLCNKHNVYFLADEIWCDLVYAPAVHTPVLTL